ncbi:MAG: cytidylate kinase-like family protein [Gammaproteobacteria bacterium]|nr:cytidylate kinase-like family protein [Gammaproteobacteria bacterium]
MKCSVERLIEALIGVELARERKAAEEKAAQARKAGYVVTVSRGYGSLGKRIAEALADRLEVRCCDRSILEGVAQRADVDIKLVERLDENLEHVSTLPWKAFFKGKSFPKERYLHYLVKVVLNISKKGGVIVGRGAHLILGPNRTFRVRIIGSLDVCAQRVAEREELDIEVARERVVTVNRQRADYLEQLYGEGIDDCSDYDLVLNTDRFALEQAVALILHGMEQAGYDIPAELMQAI